jgi:hypothetical protein
MRKLSRYIKLSAITALAFAFVASPVARALSYTVVAPSSMNGWYMVPGTGGITNFVTSAGALGSGAVQFTTVTNDDYTRLKKDVSLKLSDMSVLSYQTKQVDVPDYASGYAAASLRLYVDLNNDGIYDLDNGDDVLIFEPYYTAPVTAGWQTWNAGAGYWWSGMEMTYNGHHSVGAGGYDTNFQLSDVVADYANATVKTVGLGTGNWNAPWVVQADALTVNNTVYNFEKIAPVSELTDKDQCKNGGWQGFEMTFKNQGQCVAYVVSSQNSKHHRTELMPSVRF